MSPKGSPKDLNDPDRKIKRRKASVACDYCRSKKLRCDWMLVKNTSICKHCYDYGLTCTTTPRQQQVRPSTTRIKAPPKQDSSPATPTSTGPNANHRPVPTETRYLGSTSLSHLFNEVASDSNSAAGVHDAKYGHYRADDGFLFTALQEQVAGEARLYKEKLATDVIDKLVNWYRINVAPLYPVISPEELADVDSLPVTSIFSICAISSLSRNVPSSVFLSARKQLTNMLESSNVTTSCSISHCQAILISCLSSEVHAPTTTSGGSLSWLRSGTAIRMAQDLGLHRYVPGDRFADNGLQRKRTWMACVICDRWYSGTFGQPLMIKLSESDNSLETTPSPTSLPVALVEIYKISVLMGRILRELYSPGGIASANDVGLQTILNDLDRLRGDLPDILIDPAKYDNSSLSACAINLMYATAEVLLFRPFIHCRQRPSHISFGPSPSRWSAVVYRARQAIHWAATDGDVLLDVWFVGMYSLTFLSLVQFHAHVKDGDALALESLKEADETMSRWAEANRDQDEALSLRNKVSDILHTLYMGALHKRIPSGYDTFTPSSSLDNFKNGANAGRSNSAVPNASTNNSNNPGNANHDKSNKNPSSSSQAFSEVNLNNTVNNSSNGNNNNHSNSNAAVDSGSPSSASYSSMTRDVIKGQHGSIVDPLLPAEYNSEGGPTLSGVTNWELGNWADALILDPIFNSEQQDFWSF